jgi:hypothetical protein
MYPKGDVVKRTGEDRCVASVAAAAERVGIARASMGPAAVICGGRMMTSSVNYFQLRYPMRAAVLCFSLVLPFVLSGCVGYYYIHPGTLEPDRAVVDPGQRDAIWQRSISVLLEQGYVPQVLNEKACYINAKRREDIENDQFAHTIALVSISPEGNLRVEVSGGGLFSSESQFLSAVGLRQRLLMDLILNRKQP